MGAQNLLCLYVALVYGTSAVFCPLSAIFMFFLKALFCLTIGDNIMHVFLGFRIVL